MKVEHAVKRRRRPTRPDDRLRRLVEYMERPGATRKAAAAAFHTVERNIGAMLKDRRAQAWSGASSSLREAVRDFEAGRAENQAALWRAWAASGMGMLQRDPKLKFILKEISEEEIDRLGDLSLDDAYQFALGHKLQRRATQRYRRVKEKK